MSQEVLKSYFEHHGIQEVAPDSDWETDDEVQETSVDTATAEEELCPPGKRRRPLEEDRPSGVDNSRVRSAS